MSAESPKEQPTGQIPEWFNPPAGKTWERDLTRSGLVMFLTIPDADDGIVTIFERSISNGVTAAARKDINNDTGIHRDLRAIIEAVFPLKETTYTIIENNRSLQKNSETTMAIYKTPDQKVRLHALYSKNGSLQEITLLSDSESREEWKKSPIGEQFRYLGNLVQDVGMRAFHPREQSDPEMIEASAIDTYHEEIIDAGWQPIDYFDANVFLQLAIGALLEKDHQLALLTDEQKNIIVKNLARGAIKVFLIEKTPPPDMSEKSSIIPLMRAIEKALLYTLQDFSEVINAPTYEIISPDKSNIYEIQTVKDITQKAVTSKKLNLRSDVPGQNMYTSGRRSYAVEKDSDGILKITFYYQSIPPLSITFSVQESINVQKFINTVSISDKTGWEKAIEEFPIIQQR